MNQDPNIISKSIRQYILKAVGTYLTGITIIVFLLQTPPKALSHSVAKSILAFIIVLLGLTSYYFCRYRDCRFSSQYMGRMALEVLYAAGVFIILVFCTLVVCTPFLRIY